MTGRIQASLRLVGEEIQDCRKTKEDTVSPFTPDPSVKAKCETIAYTFERRKKRSNTTLEGRVRADAFTGESPLPRHRPTISVCGPILREGPISSPHILHTRRVAVHVAITFLEPAAVIVTKNLIGSCNAVNAYPFGVACTVSGSLLVSDTRHHLFRVLTPTGKCLETLGSEGKGEGQFTEPTGVAVDGEGNILVLDGKNPGRLQKFSAAGSY